MKSFPQKQRELESEPVYTPTQISKKVNCPFCKGKMYEHNLEKYGKCWTCYMTKKNGR